MPLLKKRTKLQKLVAVCEQFHESLNEVPDSKAEKLLDNWKSIRGVYQNPPPGVKPSQLASGLEQGLLELPMLIASIAEPHRARVAQALHVAIQVEFPSFLATQEARLSKIRGRGRISTESEFMLVRHAIDILEGEQNKPAVLSDLYELIEAFEARGGRAA